MIRFVSRAYRYLRELGRALRPAKKIWSAAVTLDATDDPGLVRDMALAGCTGVFIGFESLTDQNPAAARIYKRSNRLWRFLIKHQLVHAVWRPLVELTRRRHLALRQRLATQTKPSACGTPIPASV
jgi:hypothetical protein